MTDDEWEGVCTLIEAAWPGEFGDVQRVAYRTLLDDHSAEQLVAALKALARQGGSFRPSVSEIAGTLHADPSKPTWPEALRDLRRALAVRQAYHATDAEKEARCATWLREHSHELVACFFEAQTYERLRSLPIDDPDYGQLETKRLAEQWEAFVGRAEERVAHGLPVATGTRKQLGPRKPDFAGVLTEGGS
jgi:hypothetical protein